VEPLRGYVGLDELLERIAANEIDGGDRRFPGGRESGARIGHRLHLEADAQRLRDLLHNQVVETPGADRSASRAVVETGEPGLCEGELIADRRNDADGLDRLK